MVDRRQRENRNLLFLFCLTLVGNGEEVIVELKFISPLCLTYSLRCRVRTHYQVIGLPFSKFPTTSRKSLIRVASDQDINRAFEHPPEHEAL